MQPSHIQEAAKPEAAKPRLLLRVKRFDSSTQKYGSWVNLTTHDLEYVRFRDPKTGFIVLQKCIDFPLKHGGSLRVFPELITGPALENLISEIDDDPLFRQYTIQNHNEPRLHYLLSSSDDDDETCTPSLPKISEQSPGPTVQSPQSPSNVVMTRSNRNAAVSPINVVTPPRSSSSDDEAETEVKASGYNYHGVKMEPVAPMSRFPSIVDVSKILGALANVNSFSIGGNIILYRNGRDHISWHADDTQGEEKVCCLVAVCPDVQLMRTVEYDTNCARPLKIKRKLTNGAHLEHGDEFIEVWVGAGDAYEMDNLMQESYLHSLPKTNSTCLTSPGAQDENDFRKHRRVALVFRHGERSVMMDSGKPVDTLTAPAPITPEQRNPLGTMLGLLVGMIYTRVQLAEMRAHSAVQGGISGNVDVGARAVVVSRQNVDLMEADAFHSFLYTSNTMQGAGSMFISWQRNTVIRVFRSSALENPFYALNYHKPATGTARYRYDGLYRIEGVWDTEHLQNRYARKRCPTPKTPCKDKQLYTFLLVRVGTRRDAFRAGETSLPYYCHNTVGCGVFKEYCKLIGTMCSKSQNVTSLVPLAWLNKLLIASGKKWQCRARTEAGALDLKLFRQHHNLYYKDKCETHDEEFNAASTLLSMTLAKASQRSPQEVSSHGGYRQKNEGNHKEDDDSFPLNSVIKKPHDPSVAVPGESKHAEDKSPMSCQCDVSSKTLVRKEGLQQSRLPCDRTQNDSFTNEQKQNDSYTLDCCDDQGQSELNKESEHEEGRQDQRQGIECKRFGKTGNERLRRQPEKTALCDIVPEGSECNKTAKANEPTAPLNSQEGICPLGQNKAAKKEYQLSLGIVSSDEEQQGVQDGEKHNNRSQASPGKSKYRKNRLTSEIDRLRDSLSTQLTIIDDGNERRSTRRAPRDVTKPKKNNRSRCSQEAEKPARKRQRTQFFANVYYDRNHSAPRLVSPHPLPRTNPGVLRRPTSQLSLPKRSSLRRRGLSRLPSSPSSSPSWEPKVGSESTFGDIQVSVQYASRFHSTGFALRMVQSEEGYDSWTYFPAMIVSPFDLLPGCPLQQDWVRMYRGCEAKNKDNKPRVCDLEYLVHWRGTRDYDLIKTDQFIPYESANLRNLGLTEADIRNRLKIGSASWKHLTAELRKLKVDAKKHPNERTHYYLEVPHDRK